MGREPSSLDEELEAAREDLRRGELARATERLEALRARAPAHPRVGAGLAQAYLKRGRVDAALAVATDAATRAPTSYHALVALGQARRAAHDLPGAREAFERARAVADNAFVSTQLGRVLLALGEPAAALDVALTALRRLAAGEPPRDDPGLRGLEGDALTKLGRHEEATRAYTAAQALAPDDAFAHKRLLEARLRELPAGEALQELEALARVPAYAERAYVHELRGKRLRDAGRPAEAADAYARALALAPDSAFDREQLGFCASRAGDYERALQALRPSFLADPANQYVRSTVIGALRKLGRTDELRALLDEALAAHPSVWPLKAERKRLGDEGQPEPAPRPRKPRKAREPAPRREESLELPGLTPPPAGGKHRG
jgi:tetratricopeptide (TPR) repeat protein